jgi:hypothetical protein
MIDGWLSTSRDPASATSPSVSAADRIFIEF